MDVLLGCQLYIKGGLTQDWQLVTYMVNKSSEVHARVAAHARIPTLDAQVHVCISIIPCTKCLNLGQLLYQ